MAARRDVTPEQVGQPPVDVSAVAETDAPMPDEAPYGHYVCPECDEGVTYLHPGWQDEDAKNRELVCPNGHRFRPAAKHRAKPKRD